MELNHVGLPINLDLPFFAYGIFKPGQLAYPLIEDYVKGKPLVEIIDHEMLYRDGFALIRSDENDDFKTEGFLIQFSNPQEAYDKIGKSKPKELYVWQKSKSMENWQMY